MSELEPLAPSEGVDRFLAHRKPSVRKSTFNNAQTRLGHFLRWCAEREIEDLNGLSGRDLADFVSWRQGQVKPITLQKQLSTVRMALEFWADIEAVEEGLREKVHAPELPDGAEARDAVLNAERAAFLLDRFERFDYASRNHVILALLWRTGMRRGALRSIDLCDLHEGEQALSVQHRPESDTPLKNGEGGERWIYLGPTWSQLLADYVEYRRVDVRDDYGREPLFSTAQGRIAETTITNVLYQMTRPCLYGGCPHDRDPSTCEAAVEAGASKCPSSRSPHTVRRGAITSHLNGGVPPEIVSERMDVSLGVLYQHYDARSDREKMDVRKEYLKE